LIARCNAREKRQRLCSVIGQNPEFDLQMSKQPSRASLATPRPIAEFHY
jgi:hypothetical protein